MKRLFIAINLPPHLKEIITKSVIKLISIRCGGLPDEAKDFRWVPPENWHLTLVFLGGQPDEAIIPILESIKESAQNFPAPAIEFEKVILAPPNKEPRMVWLTGTEKTSKILGEIKNKLEDDLIEKRVRFKPENRPYNSHLTLMRFLNNPPILTYKNAANLNFIAESIDLMESRLKPSGAEYDVLSSMKFFKI